MILEILLNSIYHKSKYVHSIASGGNRNENKYFSKQNQFFDSNRYYDCFWWAYAVSGIK